MVFSSVPVYLDPSNYFQVQQQQNYPQQQVGTTCGIENSHRTSAPPPPPPTTRGGGSGLLKPNSIAEQARLANIPQPETGLKCPRCESTNTKFCYYNNYRLSQPRHFCKTCKRYWTRGGALRNVPVGGGIRRNKRKKSRSNRSKYSSAISDQQRQTGSSSTSTYTTTVSSNSCNNTDLMSHLPPQPQPQPQLPFLPSLHNLTADFGNIGFNYFRDLETKIVTAGSDIVDNEFKVGEIGSGIAEQWRVQEQIQQFPFLANLEPSIGTGGQLYPNFQTSTQNNIDQSSYLNVQLRSKLPLDSGVIRPARVKMEENNNEGLNLSRNLLGSLGNEQYWGSGSGSGNGNGNAWIDHFSSSFTSSSTP